MSTTHDLIKAVTGIDPINWLTEQGATKKNPTDALNEVLTANGYWKGNRTDSIIYWLQSVTGLTTRDINVLKANAALNDLYTFLPTPIYDFNGDPDNITEAGTGADVWTPTTGAKTLTQGTDANRPDKSTRGVTLTRSNQDFMQITGGIDGLKHSVSDFAFAVVFKTNFNYAGLNAVIFTTGGLHNTAQGFALYMRTDNRVIFTCKAYLGTNQSISSNDAVNDNTLYVAICQRIGGISKMWINAVEQADTLDTSTVNVSWNGSYPDHLLGKRHVSSTWHYDGLVADMVFYATGQTLTSAQISSLTTQLLARSA